jgi:hypothetical protein
MVNNLKMPSAHSDTYEILRNTNTPDAGSLVSKRPAEAGIAAPALPTFGSP